MVTCREKLYHKPSNTFFLNNIVEKTVHPFPMLNIYSLCSQHLTPYLTIEKSHN